MAMTIWNWQNEENTSDLTCPCGSWKAHWERISGEGWPSECTVYACNNPPEVGAHIINDGGDRIIVPMCHSCNNQRTGEFKFGLKDVILVPSNESDSCGQD
ncbi:hypothetical protein KKI90_21665 [Xenorhabdus bovienii]|uniref:Uncharacterized protein n=1 Tax=Xenorhabdus bovienii TaxID=40576 RepID=A0AAJ1J986_XENBV|nr:hypothetical protein [Xenorhabdus bovienii]MDE1479507.1 hypothetical protein [Xenorhabdus bovienii]MDE1488859.1 hypothetical protein [Xenorhabdus bovienii]MDE9479746.1 hypothetical protein [Xenorhabdus bovienii]MDE9511169.1 hypothetical protein [Xenorhabdus bovienii]MDE9522826.1 hypothetical protein [Xenorhabdus bovienii]